MDKTKKVRVGRNVIIHISGDAKVVEKACDFIEYEMESFNLPALSVWLISHQLRATITFRTKLIRHAMKSECLEFNRRMKIADLSL